MLLDIHTHHLDRARHGKAIYNLDGTDEAGMPWQPDVYYSPSLHPWTLPTDHAMHLVEHLYRLAAHPQAVAIGEAGLDALRGPSLDEQAHIFRQVIRLSEACGLPLIIHCVKAVDLLLAIRRTMRPSCPWIWHGFRGKPTQMHDLTMRHGLYLSFGAHYHSDSLRLISPDRLCLETDESPLPIEQLLEQAAAIRGQSAGELAEQLQTTYRRLFRLPANPATP